jgi:hypothetical protein
MGRSITKFVIAALAAAAVPLGLAATSANAAAAAEHGARVPAQEVVRAEPAVAADGSYLFHGIWGWVSGGYNIATSSTTKLVFQDDGNLVLYCLSNNKAIWASNTAGARGDQVNFQNDGNLVIYLEGHAIWDSGTEGNPKDYAVVQNDNNFVIYDGSTPIWASNTNGDC